MTDLLDKAFARFDAENSQDPNQDEGVPKELLYAQRMSERLATFKPDASDALKLAARAQHIRRWELARTDYPEGRKGYLAWRAQQKKQHASIAVGILSELGAGDALQASVRALILKRGLKTDPDTQALEDVICLVFLEHYFDAFIAKHDDEKLVDIVQKTWAKMTPKGHEVALTLPLGERAQSIIKRAL